MSRFLDGMIRRIQGRLVAPTKPADGEALVWSDANNRWEPGAASGGGGGAGYGAWSARPTAGSDNDGQMYLATDGVVASVGAASVWQQFGPIFKLTQPPLASAFTQYNSTSGVALTDDKGTLLIQAPADGGAQQRRVWVKSYTTPFSLKVAFMPVIYTVQAFFRVGIGWRQNSGNKQAWLYMAPWAGSDLSQEKIYYSYWSSGYSGGPTADYGSARHWPVGLVNWLGLVDDGTNRKVYYSNDGQVWHLYLSHGRTTDLTPDEVGFFLQPAGSYEGAFRILSWEEGVLTSL